MKKLVCVILVLSFILAFPFSVSANSLENTWIIDLSADFVVKTSISPFSNNSENTDAGSMKIRASQNSVEMVLHFDNADNITLAGNLYLLNSGAYAGLILGGNFEANKNIDLITVKVEQGLAATSHYASSEPVVCIKYADDLNNISYIYANITDSQYLTLKSIAEANTIRYQQSHNSSDYSNMIASLCFPLDAAISHQSPEIELSINDSLAAFNGYTEEVALSSTITSFSGFGYNSLANFISNIKTEGTTSFSDLGVSASTFSQSYAIRTNTISDAVGWASAYDAQEYDGYRYVVLNIMDFILTQNISLDTESVSAQLSIKDYVYFEYNVYTGEIRYLTDMGLKVKNVNIGISKLYGNYQDVFKTVERNGIVRSPEVSVSSLIGLIPKLSLLSTLCSSYTVATTGYFGSGEYDIGNSYDEQVIRYNNQVCRAISLNSNNSYIQYIGDYMHLSGIVVTSGSGTYRCSLSFTVDGFVG